MTDAPMTQYSNTPFSPPNTPSLHHPTSPPLVWYVAAGYGLPAGIEAHVLHYATEMRKHGFDTKVVVFYRLPRPEHRFLLALRERGVPVVSLYEAALARSRMKGAALFLPWMLRGLVVKRSLPALKSFGIWMLRNESMGELDRRLAGDRPDIIHVFGRLPHEAWPHLPAERTIFHEMMTGTVDPHWRDYELAAFRSFAERCARYFAPGSGVAENVRREFGIQREIVPVFTMCPDEAPEALQVSGVRCQVSGETQSAGLKPETRNLKSLRFGILCRLVEQKGISYLLEALKQYRDRHGDVDFIFAGIGPLESEIRDFAARNSLANVRLQRVATSTGVLAHLDVFVHPSVDDAMPMSIAEALMCGVPCVVCRVGGCADLVRDGQEGFVIEPRRADLILDRMERFAAMPAGDMGRFRARARARYEEVCRPESVGAVVAARYREVMSGV